MADNSIQSIRENTVSELIRNGISKNEAIIEVDILLNYAFKLKKKDIITQSDLKLPEDKVETFNSLVARRIKEKIPVQYLTNTAYFMGNEFYVDKNVLIPRPETEILVEEVLKIIKNKNLKIIDIGTGSGCIACMLAKLSGNNIIASDISPEALNIAKMNAERLEVQDKIRFIQSDILSNIEEKFDIIVSNPPYIPVKDQETLQIEVQLHEPHLALFADDEKGISFYKKLIEQSREKLNPQGYLAIEIGFSQAKYITELLEKANFVNIKAIKDYNNIERVIIAQNNSI